MLPPSFRSVAGCSRRMGSRSALRRDVKEDGENSVVSGIATGGDAPELIRVKRPVA